MAPARGRPRAAPPRSNDPPPVPSADDVPGARPGALPKLVAPQLATLVEQAPAGDEWLHEFKYDGYRILARLEDGRARLLSRNGRDWTASFPTVAEGVVRHAASVVAGLMRIGPFSRRRIRSGSYAGYHREPLRNTSVWVIVVAGSAAADSA